jgi:hypothetical protein
MLIPVERLCFLGLRERSIKSVYSPRPSDIAPHRSVFLLHWYAYIPKPFHGDSDF